MKKAIKIILLVVALALIGGWMYWQQHKKRLIKDGIESAIAKGSDSLYFIHYDSSFIDEVNGNASFYHVSLQSDSLQTQLMLFDTTSSATIYNIYIDEVTIMGANIPGLLSNTVVEAKSILLKRPVVYIISSKKKEKKLLNTDDSMVIYKKLLGKFNSINAGEIIVEQGNLFFSDKTGQLHTAFREININLKKFEIDRLKNYQNIVSYFVKDVVANVKEIDVKDGTSLAIFTDVEYNAPKKFIRLKKFQQKNEKDVIVFDVNNTYISNISTDAFVLNQQLKAEELASDGGLLTFYRKKSTKVATEEKEEIEIDNNYFNEALLNTVAIGKTKILIYNRDKPGDKPFVIDNVRFNAVNIQKLDSGTNIKNLISSSDWTLSADGFSLMTEDKKYKINVGPFEMNNGSSIMRIKSLAVVPMFTEESFSRSIKVQEDLYNLSFRNIELKGINSRLLITEKRLEAISATLQPVVKIYRDRLVAPDMTSKVGKYPQQLIQKIKLPFSVKTIFIKNGMVTYKEKSDVSGKAGIVTFQNINGSISNVTNISDVISKNNMLVVDASASFMGLSPMKTVWKLSLNSPNGAFAVSGSAGAFNAPAINPMIEPLGMASFKKGRVNKLTFNLTGTNYATKGTSTMLYQDLKVELLKKDSGDLKKKGLMSLLTNALIKNSNPLNGVTRQGEISFQRDTTKSFFNLLWKSVFSGIKKTAQKL